MPWLGAPGHGPAHVAPMHEPSICSPTQRVANLALHISAKHAMVLRPDSHQSNKKKLVQATRRLRSDVRDGGGEEGWAGGWLALTGDGYACRVWVCFFSRHGGSGVHCVWR
jgi:hypothetical protein